MLVKLHQAKDGQLFKTHRECFLHEARMRVMAEVPKLIDGGAIVQPPEPDSAWPDWAAQFVAVNAVPLRALLEAALTDTRKKPTARKAAPTKE